MPNLFVVYVAGRFWKAVVLADDETAAVARAKEVAVADGEEWLLEEGWLAERAPYVDAVGFWL